MISDQTDTEKAVGEVSLLNSKLSTATMTETNPSYVLYGPGKAKIEHLQVPKLESNGDVILRVQFVGVCGSDVRQLLSLLFGIEC